MRYIEKLKSTQVQIILLALFVAIVLLAGKSLADATARSYQDSFKTWKSNLPTLQQRTAAAVFSSKIIVGRQETQAEYDVQNAACQAIQDMKRNADQGKLTPGSLGFHIFGALSSDYQNAKRQSDERTLTFDIYNRAVQEQLNSMSAECRFYVDRTALGVQRAADLEKVKAASDQFGVVQELPDGRIVCGSPDGCIPTDPQKIPAYIDASRAAEVDYASKNIDLYKKTCDATFVKPVCGAYITYFEKTKAAHENFLRVLDKQRTSPSNLEVITALDALTATERDQSAEIKAKFAAAFPDADMNGSFEAKKLITVLQAAEQKIAESTAKLTKL